LAFAARIASLLFVCKTSKPMKPPNLIILLLYRARTGLWTLMSVLPANASPPWLFIFKPDPRFPACLQPFIQLKPAKVISFSLD
jgi:hypothetical protein